MSDNKIIVLATHRFTNWKNRKTEISLLLLIARLKSLSSDYTSFRSALSHVKKLSTNKAMADVSRWKFE